MPLDGPQGIQKVVTENVSTKGVRVIADLFYAPGKHVVLMALKDRSKASARVVYCQPLKNGKFAVGLELETDAVVREKAH